MTKRWGCILLRLVWILFFHFHSETLLFFSLQTVAMAVTLSMHIRKQKNAYIFQNNYSGDLFNKINLVYYWNKKNESHAND